MPKIIIIVFMEPWFSENEDFREQENEKSGQNKGEQSGANKWADFTFSGSGRIKLNDSNSTGTGYWLRPKSPWTGSSGGY